MDRSPRADKPGELARNAGIERGPGLEGDIEAYRKLRDAGRIPTMDIILDPAYLIELRSR
ncbi:hypothetical protein A7982_12849 [Minicystis rosea]|nr:hypothetical protein A7982_12849 [Minicystis rosea]